MALFEVGDVVRLKSGGPNMTVSYNGPVDFGHSKRHDLVTCKWFSGDKVESARFDEKELELVVEASA